MEKRRELEKAAWERKEFRAAADVAGPRIESTLSSEGVWYGDPTRRNLRKHLVENSYVSKHPMELIDNNLIQDWLDQSLFRRLLVVNLGPREPGLWLEQVREP